MRYLTFSGEDGDPCKEHGREAKMRTKPEQSLTLGIMEGCLIRIEDRTLDRPTPCESLESVAHDHR